MQDEFIKPMLITAASLLFVCVPIWLLLWIVFPKLDRRPKDSVRCKKCWYDLRACTTDHCPECGADLRQTKVWPKGKPNRARLVHFIMAWFWVCAVLMAIGANRLDRNSHRIAEYCTVEKGTALLVRPQSETYDGAAILIAGHGLEFFPRYKAELSANPKTAIIEIYASGTLVQAVTFNVDSMEVVRHPFDYANRDHEKARSASRVTIQYGEPLTPELLASFYPTGIAIDIDQQLHEEMAYLIDTALLAAETDTLVRDESGMQEVIGEVERQLDANPRFVEVQPLEDSYGCEVDPISDWILLVVPGIGLVILVFGIYLIRRWCYNGDAVAWTPQTSDETVPPTA